MNAFINQVNALKQPGNNKPIPASIAAAWIATANLIITHIINGWANCNQNMDGYIPPTADVVPTGNDPVNADVNTDNQVIDAGSQSASIAVFPNPATDKVTLRIKGVSGASELSVTDQFGKTVLTQSWKQGLTEITLDLSGSQFPSGVYFVSTHSEGQRLTQRLVITK